MNRPREEALVREADFLAEANEKLGEMIASLREGLGVPGWSHRKPVSPGDWWCNDGQGETFLVVTYGDSSGRLFGKSDAFSCPAEIEPMSPSHWWMRAEVPLCPPKT